ncbi:LPS export ABC transporter periplasmic protein LptC [Candidatus Thioglobus sp. NP1]|uniref:LPS export ABC transporter periplasmic protein LptC n=1 Tax=Candidatus Thioglobus sp. NP1 TaxID=2508687 RepID=UPI000DED9BB9|nr:LPS export ABC transporter periplasmic protein LptC [Candidatus Thioglobus sp. NP1]AXE61228.1 LPS export ABC transporter periplasmic protein LptC [Candidatus Thioglobus sp. NP1]
MTFFKSKKIQSLIIAIIVLVVSIWLFQNNYLKLLVFQKKIDQSSSTNLMDKEIAYLEKIDNFIIKEYSEKLILLRTIKAETYYSYKNSPIQLLNVEVKTFNESGQEGIVLKSNQAEMLESRVISFNGEVNIKTKSGISHELDTESLIVFSNNGKIKSNKKITYLGENSKINAQEMEMDIDSNTMFLKGEVQILQTSDTRVDTTDLYISHTNGQKKYNSKGKTSFQSTGNRVNSEKGFDMDANQNLMNFLGQVEILNPSSGSKIKTSNLVVDRSNGGEFFKSNEPSHFQSGNSEIKSKQMYYDAASKRLELTGKVFAVYE